MLGVSDGELVRVQSRRGETVTRCMVTERCNQGATYMTYQWWVGACNELTNSKLDPRSRTPEYKYCACKVEKIDDQEAAEKMIEKSYQSLQQRMGIRKEERQA